MVGLLFFFFSHQVSFLLFFTGRTEYLCVDQITVNLACCYFFFFSEGLLTHHFNGIFTALLYF